MKRLKLWLGCILHYTHYYSMPQTIHIKLTINDLKEPHDFYSSTQSPIAIHLKRMFKTDRVEVDLETIKIKGVSYKMSTPFKRNIYEFIKRNNIPFRTYAEKQKPFI